MRAVEKMLPRKVIFALNERLTKFQLKNVDQNAQLKLTDVEIQFANENFAKDIAYYEALFKDTGIVLGSGVPYTTKA